MQLAHQNNEQHIKLYALPTASIWQDETDETMKKFDGQPVSRLPVDVYRRTGVPIGARQGFLSQPPVAARGHWPPVALASEADFLRAPGEGTGEKAPRPPGLRFRKRHLNFM